MGILIIPKRSLGSALVMTVKTDNAGISASDQFTLALEPTTSYSYQVDWGDGNIESYSGSTNRTHTYSVAGTYEIEIRGAFPAFFYNNTNDDTKIISVDDWGTYGANSLSQANAFRGGSNIVSLPAGSTDNLKNVTDFGGTWNNLSSLTVFPLLNTSAGVNFNSTWNACSSLTSFPLLDTSLGTNFSFAWNTCSGLTSFPLLNTSLGTSFVRTWQGCGSLTSFPLLNMSSATNLDRAWNNCSSLTAFPLINIGNVVFFSGAWNGCSSLTSFPANMFDSWTATPNNGCFSTAWSVCNSLPNTSVENILVSIDASGQSAPAVNTDITIDYNVATGGLTAATNTAITSLKGKGWTPRINGVLV